jgi:hypothetical protein
MCDGAGAKDLTGADRLQRFTIVILIWAATRRDREDSQIDLRRGGEAMPRLSGALTAPGRGRPHDEVTGLAARLVHYSGSPRERKTESYFARRR